ncbi:MAG: endonuclease/exonuclease/phosphatase family protein [Bacteroidota bacterium]
MKKFLFYVLVLVVAVTALFNILGYFGRTNWITDLFSHFKWQYLLIITTGTIIIFFIRRKLSLIFIPFIIALIIEITPLYLGGNKDKSLTQTTKIVCINLLSSNDQFEDVENYIKQKNPELIVLQEFNTLWQLMLEPKLNDYKFRLTIPRADNFGIAVYSKLKVSELKELLVGDAEVPSIQGDIEIGQRKIRLIATHPLPPVRSDYFEYRNMQLSELGSYIAELNSEVILIGDLNTSSFSTHFKNLASTARLIDTRKGFGQLTTWPTWFNLARTTLDHCLVTEGISVKSREIGNDIGSDHLPIFVELGVE